MQPPKNQFTGTVLPESTPGFTTLEKNQQDDLGLFRALDTQIQGVLEQINYIATTIKINKKVPVEDMGRKIKKALQKIKSYLSQDPENIQNSELNPNQQPGGVELKDPLEKNPLVDDLGGMPLDSISDEWQDLAKDFNILDKAELENLINNKLKDKLKNREKLANRLKNAPGLKNAPKPGAAMTPKFKQIEQTVKYILKEMPVPPAPAPRETPLPRPRPGGF